MNTTYDNTNIVHSERKKEASAGRKNAADSPYILDTLAQLGKNTLNRVENDGEIEGFDVAAATTKDDKKSLLKRARRKYMTGAYLGALIDASKNNEKSTLHKSYWNSYHCARLLTLRSDGLLSGRYCKNRWCLVCNSIRTAQYINRYQPVLETWEDKHFVTLTIPNVAAEQLPVAMEEIYLVFAKIKDRLKKRFRHGQSPKFVGLRKLECTYNPDRNDYHPHFHFIVKEGKTAGQLKKLWVQEWNKGFLAAVWGEASDAAQDMRKANDKSTLELFKYFTKVIQKPNKDGKRLIYADAMDVIFNAVRGRRVFQPFGFKAPKADPENEEVTTDDVFAIMEYTWEGSDWHAEQMVVDHETGEVTEKTEDLTGYKPSEKVKEMAESVVIRKGGQWTGAGGILPEKPITIKPIDGRKAHEHHERKSKKAQREDMEKVLKSNL